MQFYDLKYGFLHLPSLFIFWNPHSPHNSVRQLIGNSKFPYTREEWKNTAHLSREERSDLIQRISAIVHERKHFHDILLTPSGNQLFRKAFIYAIRASALVNTDWSREQPVPLPLKRESISNHEGLELAYASQKAMYSSMESIRPAMELCATYVQLHFVWRTFGEDATEALFESFQEDPLYAKPLAGLGHMFLHEIVAAQDKEGVLAFQEGKAFFRDDELPGLIHRAIVYGLAKSDGGNTYYQELFGSLRKVSPVKRRSRFRELVEAADQNFTESLTEADRRNDEFRDALGKGVSVFPAEVAEHLLAVFADFAEHARVLRSAVKQDPASYFNYIRYLNPSNGVLEPHLYSYSDDDLLSVITEKQPVFDDQELYELVRWDDLAMSSLRMGPLGPLGSQTLNRALWVEFAKSIGAAPALLEKVEWYHPLHGWWLRTMGKVLDLTFARSLAF